jgi:hypothetical protein
VHDTEVDKQNKEIAISHEKGKYQSDFLAWKEKHKPPKN